MTVLYSELRQSPRLDLAAMAPLAWPLTIYLEPTNVCNFDCEFCFQSLSDYKERAAYYEHMPMDLFRQVIAEIREHGGVKSLKLYSFGEPMLHAEIGEMARLANMASDRVELTTNGTPLTETKAQALIDAELDYLRISIYRDTEYKPSFPGIIRRNVERLRRLRDAQGKTKPHIFVKVFTPEELPAVQASYAGIADEIGFDGFHSQGSDLVPLESLTGKHVACPYPFYTMVIKSNGDVVPCCVAWETSLVCGNAREQSLVEIWNGERLANIHREHLSGNRKSLAACAKCDTLFQSPDSVDALTYEVYEQRRKALRA